MKRLSGWLLQGLAIAALQLEADETATRPGRGS